MVLLNIETSAKCRFVNIVMLAMDQNFIYTKPGVDVFAAPLHSEEYNARSKASCVGSQ